MFPRHAFFGHVSFTVASAIGQRVSRTRTLWPAGTASPRSSSQFVYILIYRKRSTFHGRKRLVNRRASVQPANFVWSPFSPSHAFVRRCPNSSLAVECERHCGSLDTRIKSFRDASRSPFSGQNVLCERGSLGNTIFMALNLKGAMVKRNCLEDKPVHARHV